MGWWLFLVEDPMIRQPLMMRTGLEDIEMVDGIGLEPQAN